VSDWQIPARVVGSVWILVCIIATRFINDPRDDREKSVAVLIAVCLIMLPGWYLFTR
jgi:hypothetical protein